MLIGLSLGALTLTRGLLTPVTLMLALLLCTRLLSLPLARTLGHLGHPNRKTVEQLSPPMIFK